MLKNIKYYAAVGFVLFGFNNAAHASVDDALANMCNIVKADDKGELRKKMRQIEADYKMKLRDYYTNISCNGNSLLRAALLSDAVDTGSLIVKKMPSKILKAAEQDGKTLQTWISEQGFENHAISAKLASRI